MDREVWGHQFGVWAETRIDWKGKGLLQECDWREVAGDQDTQVRVAKSDSWGIVDKAFPRRQDQEARRG